MDREESVASIARGVLRVSLTTRNSDDLDFHTRAVWELRLALEAAYDAGFDEACKRIRMEMQKP